MESVLRIDKYLWAVRVFKTRSQATDACRDGRVMVNDISVKPSRDIRVGEVIKVEKDKLWCTYKVTALLKTRVSAKLSSGYIEDLTTDELIEAHKLLMREKNEYRKFGVGRPTKKVRRTIEKFKGEQF